ncbi:MAG: manganese efflux pump MntP family protein [Spirochaetia bacterium]|jgi:putative Mn2+ efflux pump MntP|nr:manganese efflux pump MntP family protein [Spirochaetia bacterium]
MFFFFGLALALSMDAFAVSVVNGYIIKNLKFRHAFRIAFSFGSFQAIMPFFGWSSGLLFRKSIIHIEHWVAFFLLAVIGVKMIYESQSVKGEVCAAGSNNKNCLCIVTLFSLSIATSIDALAVGMSFSFLDINIALPVIIIGVVTFTVCLAGVYIGDRIGHIFEDKLEIAGGIILILIGSKILLSHLLSV